MNHGRIEFAIQQGVATQLVARLPTFVMFFFIFEQQIWIAGGPLEYHRATSGTTRSYPSSLDIMSIHQFRRKPNKYEKKNLMGIERRTYRSQSLISPLGPTFVM
ncbi:hypothetical protein Hanom_Chr00s000005g01611621 [Helianthus anomalus]